MSAEPSAETEAAPETETRLQPDLPEKTYGGTEFHFLSRAGTVVGYISTEISAEEETTEYYAAVPMFIGAGCRLTQPDSEGVPVSVMYSEYSVDVVNTIMDMLTDRNLSAIAQNYRTDTGDSYYRIGIDLMQESRVLFVIGMVAWVQDIIQHSDAYPAVLPMPKYSAEQEEYAAILQSHHANSLGVPGYLTGDRPELTGVVLEAMSAFSHYSIYPEYTNTVVKSRYAVDEDTTEMLGIVFDHITNDPGILFNWGGMSQILSSDLFLGKPGGFASTYASKEKYINMTISKAVDSLRP